MAGDTSGVLQLATNGSTTAVTVDTSQNVVIGTTATQNAERLAVWTVSGSGIKQATVINNAYAYGSGLGTAASALTFTRSNASVFLPMSQIVSGNESELTSELGYMAFYTTNTTQQERMRIDSSGNLLFNSGYGSVATAYGCRAWVNFNGSGTVAIRASGNVSSITDNNTGDYTVNFTTAIVDANYSIASSAGEGASGGNSLVQLFTPVAGSFRFTTRSSSANGFQDTVNCCVAVFR